MKWLKGIGCGALLVVIASVIYVALNDSGIVSVQYADSKNPEHLGIKSDLEESGLFQMAADDIDAVYLVPRDLQIAFMDCGQPNASYDPAQSAIVMCYELVNRLIRDYRRYAGSDSVLAASVWQTTLFVFYHELGHALIDMLDLPVTGREEDAVDQRSRGSRCATRSTTSTRHCRMTRLSLRPGSARPRRCALNALSRSCARAIGSCSPPRGRSGARSVVEPVA